MSSATTLPGRYRAFASDFAHRRRLTRASVVLAVILSCQLMVVLDATIVNVALPDMKAALHFSDAQLSWVLNAYTLTFGGLLLLGARAGDLLGRRITFLTGIAVFTVASLLGGFAATGWLLLPPAPCRASAARWPRRPRWRCWPPCSPRAGSGCARSRCSPPSRSAAARSA